MTTTTTEESDHRDYSYVERETIKTYNIETAELFSQYRRNEIQGFQLINSLHHLADELATELNPDVFIQDREKTDSMPDNEHSSRYVLTKVYPNGDVDDIAYSDDPGELEEIKADVISE